MYNSYNNNNDLRHINYDFNNSTALSSLTLSSSTNNTDEVKNDILPI